MISGDLNVDLDCGDAVSSLINDFCKRKDLSRCDTLFDNHHSTIDFMITSAPKQVRDYMVVDPDISFSDHLPITAEVDILSK